MAIEFAWNAQKNQMSDIKGKEREQEREGAIKNDMIDRSRSHLNYDLVRSELNLYQRAKERVEQLKAEKKRVQKNSVITYSNIITIPAEAAKEMSEEKMQEYFKTCYDYFADRFGKENVLSAKVHLDETTPHMHLHFMPIDKETGRLQARTTMNKEALNEIHNEIPERLREKGFDVIRGSGEKTKQKLNIHEYKAKLDLEKQIQELGEKVRGLELEYSIVSSEVRTRKIQANAEYKKVEQELAMMRDDTSRFEYDTSRQREGLILAIENAESELNVTKKDLDHYTKQLQDRIDSIKQLDFNEKINLELKPNLLNKVTMPSETFEELKRRAELSIQLQKALQASEREKERLTDRNRYLESENDQIPKLLQENRQLEREVAFLKIVMTKLKETLVNQKLVAQELLDKWVGAFKSFATFEIKGTNAPVLENEKEKEGFKWHRENHESKHQEKSNGFER